MRGLKIARGLHTDLVRCRLSRIDLGEGETAIQLESDDRRRLPALSETEIADLAVASLAGLADAAAIIDEYGLAIAASDGFAEIEIGQTELDSLIGEAAREPDRLVKRAFDFGGAFSAVGIARLQDRPARFLFVSLRVEEAEPELDRAQSAEPEEAALLEAGASVADAPEQPLEAPVEEDRIESRPVAVADETTTEPERQEAAEAVADSRTPAARADERDAKAEAVEPASRQSAPPAAGFRFSPPATPVRFAFVIDRDQTFRSVSPELAAVLGPNAADVVGRSWSEVARVFGFDLYGDIRKLLTKRDTWSGKSVMWPIQGEALVAPVDLAALPSFDAARQFEGFRGFGIIRAADAVADPNQIGLALSAGEAERKEEDVASGQQHTTMSEAQKT
jgi:hypothetical protein